MKYANKDKNSESPYRNNGSKALRKTKRGGEVYT